MKIKILRGFCGYFFIRVKYGMGGLVFRPKFVKCFGNLYNYKILKLS
jgi:hypothetical protein